MHNIKIINEIDWYKASLSRVNAFMNKSFFQLILLIFSSLVRWIFFIPYKLVGDTKNIFFISHFRTDLLKDFRAIFDFLSPMYCKIEIKPYASIKIFRLYFVDIRFSWKKSNELLLNLGVSVKYPLPSRLLLFFSLLEGLKLVRVLEGGNKKINRVLSTMEMQFFENISIQYFIFYGAKTFAYQHGFYRDTGKEISSTNTNPINYLSAVCDTALIWGEASKQVLSQYVNQSLVVVGKPLLINPVTIKANSLEDKNTRSIIVLLDSIQQRMVNISIYKAVCSYYDNSNVYYVSHPDESYQYDKIGGSRVEHSAINIEKDILVGNNSSIVLQYGRLGAEILLFNKSYFLSYHKNKNGAPLPFLELKGFKFFHIKSPENQSFWNNYINCFGNDCLNNIAEQVVG